MRSSMLRINQQIVLHQWFIKFVYNFHDDFTRFSITSQLQFYSIKDWPTPKTQTFFSWTSFKLKQIVSIHMEFYVKWIHNKLNLFWRSEFIYILCTKWFHAHLPESRNQLIFLAFLRAFAVAVIFSPRLIFTQTTCRINQIKFAEVVKAIYSSH